LVDQIPSGIFLYDLESRVVGLSRTVNGEVVVMPASHMDIVSNSLLRESPRLVNGFYYLEPTLDQAASPQEYTAVVSHPYLAAVKAGSPAQKAGLRSGDNIISLGGDVLTKDTPLSLLLERHNHSASLAIQIERQGKVLDILLER